MSVQSKSGSTLWCLTCHPTTVTALVLSLQAVDYESRSSYSFSVEVLNPTVDPRFLRRGSIKDRASIRVAVLDADEPPRFSRARYHVDVSENCPPACTVGRVSAVDPDTGLTNNIRYNWHKLKIQGKVSLSLWQHFCLTHARQCLNGALFRLFYGFYMTVQSPIVPSNSSFKYFLTL